MFLDQWIALQGTAQASYRDYQRQRQMTLGDLLLENRIILLQGLSTTEMLVK